MMPLLERHGVTVIALSKDDLAETNAHRARDGLTFTLLSDPELSVIKQFGLLHEGGLEFKTFFIGSARFPLGWPVGFKQMAIPTTLLMDEAHIVRWIDQAEDYRLRGDEARTRLALLEAFGEVDSPLEEVEPDA